MYFSQDYNRSVICYRDIFHWEVQIKKSTIRQLCLNKTTTDERAIHKRTQAEIKPGKIHLIQLISSREFQALN